jgi:hypothetical protein
VKGEGLESYNGAGETQRLDTFAAQEHHKSRACRHKCGLLGLFARRWIEGSDGGVYIVLDICPDDVLGSFDHAGTLVQQRACCFAMWKHCHAAHDGLDGVRVNNALLHTGNEECRLAAAEVVVQINKERE